ncbi:F-box domain-containing protein [Mycena venus]|uniref:F-box domain-containing protein n=1 Tax=Mycena venus TaxID=2733690 RepID=A0A8H6Y4G5_9AGAR|nr:F-box domain-containing protein [Mycena venus]
MQQCGAGALGSTADLDAVRHHTLLNSNEAPLDYEVSIVASLISKADARLAGLDEEIARLEDCLKLGADRVGVPQDCASIAALALSNADAALVNLEEVVQLGDLLKQLRAEPDAPQDREVPTVASVTPTVDARLAGVDEEISHVEDRLKELREEHISLSSCRTRDLAILSPVRKVPPEVLAYIFSWTLPFMKNRANCRFSITASPWVLTYISRHWRAVACSIPCLWSSINLNFELDMNPISLSMMEAQMARSQGQMLGIHFIGCEVSDPWPQIDIFCCLAKHSSHWEELTLQMSSHLVPLLEGLRDRVPLLRRLWIQWPSPECQQGAQSIDFCQTAPSLVDVGAFNAHRFIPFRLPFHQLTRYDFNAPWRIHRGMLEHTPNLVEARIIIAFEDEPWPESGEIMRFSFLRRLCVSIPHILEFLRFPVLEEIAIEVDHRGGRNILSYLEFSVGRSVCRLRKVFFNGCPVIATEVLEKFPSIIELAIIVETHEDSLEFNSLMRSLTISEAAGSKVVAPNLRSLSFASINKGWMVSGIYLEMVKSRWEAEQCALESAAVLTKFWEQS